MIIIKVDIELYEYNIKLNAMWLYKTIVILKSRRNLLKVVILIQIELTFLLIMIEIPGLWHCKAHAVLFSNMLKLLSMRAPRGPPTRGAPLLGVGRVALKPALLVEQSFEN